MPQPKFYPFKAFGMEFLLPVVAVYALAAVCVAGIGYGVYRHVYLRPEEERVLVTLKDVNRQLASEIEEYSLHAMEEPEKHELFEDVDGKLLLRVYKDHCIMIQRQTARGVRTKLVIDLARQGALAERRDEVHPTTWFAVPLHAAQGCNRGCLNPHPGNFSWRYGRQQGAWVEVWRTWPEGCQHVQMFNPQQGLWDTNPDGTPRVRWTCCVH